MGRRAIVIAAALAAIVVGRSVPAGAFIEIAPEFAVRADLSQAEAIAPLLAKIGLPVLYPVRDNRDPQAVIADICGQPPPPLLEVVTETDANSKITTLARAAPCVRRLHNVVVIARDGDTLETIAVRLGMRKSEARRLKVRRVKSPLRRAMSTALSKGDQVLADVAPDWSYFSTYPDTVRTRGDLVRAIADAMKCGAENPETCLLRRSVFVTARALPKAAPAVFQSRAHDDQPTPPAGGGPLSAPSPAATAVAAGQWPYDVGLVKLLLQEAVTAGGLTPTKIGVADNGLAKKDGAPFPPGVFARTNEAPPGDDNDDDENNVVDDLIGAGAMRQTTDLMRNGDVALCANTPQPPYAGTDATWREEASHGSVVASIATGNLVRSSALGPALPQLLFYRIVPSGCTPETNRAISENDIVDAAEYLLFYDIDVLNMSLAKDPEESATLAVQLANILVAPNAPILVASAGNFTGDLDENPYCPACLGNNERYSSVPRQRVIIVGTAEKTLKASDFTGHGQKTVRLYAPGEPVGAIDISGQDASSFPSATSYSTPLVSFAAALLHSFGVTDQAKIRNRLLLSTWPLLGPDGSPVGRQGGPLDVGVLDLARVAAARHQTIETLDNGVRRTYVGRITAGLSAVCQERAINASAIEAARFGQGDALGRRPTVLMKRLWDQTTYFPKVEQTSCTPSGTVTMDALRDGQVVIPADRITQILFPINSH